MTKTQLGKAAAAERVRSAVARVLAAGRWLTPDLGGAATTADLTRAIVDSIPCPRRT